MSREQRDNGSASSWRLGLGCALIVSLVLALALLLPVRVRQLVRERAAAESVRQLGGTVIYGQETFLTEWFQWLMPARVVSVNLAGTRATNADLAGLCALTRLERLDLDHTSIARGGLAPLSGLTRLQTLSLETTKIGDDDLRQIAGLSTLTTLRLAGTQVSDAGLRHLAGLTALEFLSIAQTKVSDAGLAQLGPLGGLERLSIDESQVTAVSVPYLRALASLKQLSVYVPRGTGKRARDILASFAGVEVSGVRRLRKSLAQNAGSLNHFERLRGNGISSKKPPASRFVSAAESCLWGSQKPWGTTTGGVVEEIGTLTPLDPEQSERLLEILAAASPSGDWQGGGTRGPSPPLPPAVLKGEPIKDNEEFVQTLKAPRKGDTDFFGRALAYARNDVARATIPALLEFLKSPDEWLRQRAATILIRIGLDDPRVVAAIREMLQSHDMHERARAVDAFALSGFWEWRYAHLAPKMRPLEARTAVSLLLEMPEDEYRGVRNEIPRALASIIKEHHQEAERAIPVVLKSLNDVDPSVRYSGVYALGIVVEACPGKAAAITQRLLRMLQEEPRDAWWEILEGLRHVAPQSPEAADVAVPALLRLLSDRSIMPAPALLGAAENLAYRQAGAVPEVLGHIVASHPQHVKEIVLTAFRLIGDEDPRIALRASRTLTCVATGIGQRSIK